MHALFAMALAAAAAAAAPAPQASDPSWETVIDPGVGVEILRPAGWSVEALANDVLAIRPQPPLQGSVVLVPVSAPGASARALAGAVASGLKGTLKKQGATGAGGHAALLEYVEPASPAVRRTALVAAAVQDGRGLIAVLSAPDAEWEAARPALAAVARSVRLITPRGSPAAVAALALQRYEPFREPREQAFSGKLPGDWKKELSATIVAGARPYVRATAIGRSADNLYTFLHYKLASFQLPAAGLGTTGAGFRPYQPGAQVLEQYLFPAVAGRSPQGFSEWKIVRGSGVQPLFTHSSGVRFDGEEVEYRYRFKGETFAGQAFVVTYLLPGEPGTWFLYGLFGYEAPLGREEPARAAALRLLRSFSFEGRFAPQADLFWTLARGGALKALSVEPAAGANAVARRAAKEPLDSVEAAALGLSGIDLPIDTAEKGATPAPKPVPVVVGVAGAVGMGGEALGDLRQAP